jgi:hypothetical protein
MLRFGLILNVTGLLEKANVSNVTFPEGNMMELMKEDVVRALHKELGKSGSFEPNISRIVQAGCAYSAEFTREKMPWPEALVHFAKYKYHGTCGELVPERKRVFKINPQTKKVPFLWKEIGIDGEVSA